MYSLMPKELGALSAAKRASSVANASPALRLIRIRLSGADVGIPARQRVSVIGQAFAEHGERLRMGSRPHRGDGDVMGFSGLPPAFAAAAFYAHWHPDWARIDLAGNRGQCQTAALEVWQPQLGAISQWSRCK